MFHHDLVFPFLLPPPKISTADAAAAPAVGVACAADPPGVAAAGAGGARAGLEALPKLCRRRRCCCCACCCCASCCHCCFSPLGLSAAAGDGGVGQARICAEAWPPLLRRSMHRGVVRTRSGHRYRGRSDCRVRRRRSCRAVPHFGRPRGQRCHCCLPFFRVSSSRVEAGRS